MDTIYMGTAMIVLGVSLWIQYTLARKSHKGLWVLPLLYAIATFLLGFASLFVSFILIYIAQLCNSTSGSS